MGNAFYLEQTLRDLTESHDIAVGSTDGTPEAEKTVIAVVESPTMNWRWTIYEAEQTEMDDMLFFGRVDGFESELGYFTLSDLSTPGTFCYVVEDEQTLRELEQEREA